MKKNIALVATLLFLNYLQAQTIDYDNLAKEYKDIAIQALASMKPGTKKWVEETALKHPDGNFDITWAKAQIAGIPNNLGGGNPVDGLWAVMLAYQKMLNKEAREDRKMNRADAALEIKNKENMLAIDNKKIDQQKQEANEKYDNAVQAANTELTTGVVSTSAQMANGKLQVKPDSLKPKAFAPVNQPVQKNYVVANKDVIKKLQDQLAELKKNKNF